jgi:hypothetical protein
LIVVCAAAGCAAKIIANTKAAENSAEMRRAFESVRVTVKSSLGNRWVSRRESYTSTVELAYPFKKSQPQDFGDRAVENLQIWQTRGAAAAAVALDDEKSLRLRRREERQREGCR